MPDAAFELEPAVVCCDGSARSAFKGPGQEGEGEDGGLQRASRLREEGDAELWSVRMLSAES